MGPACASIQTDPLLVTLQSPKRRKSAFTSLLSHPSVLHLTTVWNIAFLDPTSWTGQADHTRTLRSGTVVILVGNQKGYETYCTADTSSVRLEIALCNLDFQTTGSGPGLDHAGSKNGSHKTA